MKLLILGIDALDCSLLDSLSLSLPNFSFLREHGISLRVNSTFPPDSDTAWATIYTGLNPARHGIVSFIDPLEKSHRIMHTEISNHILHGHTFWDVAAGSGFKTCVLFPHLGYPLWESSCDIVVRSKIFNRIKSFPEELVQGYPAPNLMTGIRGLPNSDHKGMDKYFQSMMELTRADAEFGLQLLRNKAYDLFFIYWSTIDALGHFFWSFYDPTDPVYIPSHPFATVIPEAYQLFDQILGNFLSSIPKDVHVMVLSDHGHAGRPRMLININEILRQCGFLFPASDNKLSVNRGLEIVKFYGVNVINKKRVAGVVSKVLKIAPGLMRLFTHSPCIDWEKTMAFATDMSGVKAYPYGGIMINREVVSQESYEAVCEEVLQAVKSSLPTLIDTPVIHLIARREELYCGPFIEQYPDIVLSLDQNYGLGWGINCPLITPNATRSLVPGSHRSDTGTFLMRTSRSARSEIIDLTDVFPSILDLLDINHTQPFDGQSIFC